MTEASEIHNPLFFQNGFAVVRGVWPAEEARALADALMVQCASSPAATVAMSDLTNKIPTLRSVVFDSRLLGAIRSQIGPKISFIQDFALQINRHSAGWHTDSCCKRIGRGGDLREDIVPYAVVKIILYLKGDNAGLAVIPGSHRDPMTDLHFDEVPGDYRWIRKGEVVTEPLNIRPHVRPAVVEAEAGDAIVFDVRLLHCARSLDSDGRNWIVSAPGGVASGWQGDKIVLHLCFGLDNVHSERFYSYLRYLRPELYSQDMDPEFMAELRHHDLHLSAGWGNLFERDPNELEGVFSQQTYAAELSAARSKRAVDWLEAARGLLTGRERIVAWGWGTDLDSLLSYAPDLVAALKCGRFVIVDEDAAGQTAYGIAIRPLSDSVLGDAPIILAPYSFQWREQLRRDAARLGIAKERIIDVLPDPNLEYEPVKAFDPRWRMWAG